MANAGDIRNVGSIPGSGRSPRERHGNPFQYSCLENPIDRGARWAAVYRVSKSQTRLKQLSMPVFLSEIILILKGFFVVVQLVISDSL